MKIAPAMRLFLPVLACSAALAQIPHAPKDPLPQQAADGLWVVAAQSGNSLLSATRTFSQGLTIDGDCNSGRS